MHGVAAVRADQHHHDASHYFTFAIHRDHAVAQGLSDFYLRHVSHEHRRAIGGSGQNHVADFGLVHQQPTTADQERLFTALHVAATRAHVCGFECIDHVTDPKTTRLELIVIQMNLKLLQFAAERVDLDHALDSAKFGNDFPIEHRA